MWPLYDYDIYTAAPDGSDRRRLVRSPGYDAGPFFSADGSRIVYRGYDPTDSAELADYRSLLSEGLVRLSVMEICVMNADGTGRRQLTDNGATNFAPFFHPDGETLVFASNRNSAKPGDTNVFVADWVEDAER